MDLATFREIFPEFTADRYPDAKVGFYLTEASVRLLPEVWGDLLGSGVGNYVAHMLTIGTPAAVSNVNGQSAPFRAPGLATGLVTSKSVGSVSKSYDVSVGQTDGGGSFNLTTYGQTFLTLASSVTVGARQF